MDDQRFVETDGIRLRPQGPGRFLSGGFLLVWLSGWAVGEAFVVWFLLRAAKELLEGKRPLTGSAVAIGAFMLVWLTFWTIGGLAALSELFRSFWAEDSLRVQPPGLRVLRRLGPLRSRRELQRDAILRVHVLPGTTALVAETTDGTVELSTLGTLRAREDAARTLTGMLGIEAYDTSYGKAHAKAHEPICLPAGFSEIIDPEGGIAVVPDPAIRRQQAIFVSALAMPAVLLTLFLIDRTMSNPNLLAPTLMVVVATAGLSTGAAWLARGRNEWRVESGRLIQRRRFGRRVRDRFTGVALELHVSSDSDGDQWYELYAIAAEAAGELTPRQRDKGRRRVTRAIHDPFVPRRLGAWLAARSGVAFRDRTTPQARTAELAALRRQLEESGRLGRWIAGWMGRLEARRRGPGSHAP